MGKLGNLFDYVGGHPLRMALALTVHTTVVIAILAVTLTR